MLSCILRPFDLEDKKIKRVGISSEKMRRKNGESAKKLSLNLLLKKERAVEERRIAFLFLLVIILSG